MERTNFTQKHTKEKPPIQQTQEHYTESWTMLTSFKCLCYLHCWNQCWRLEEIIQLRKLQKGKRAKQSEIFLFLINTRLQKYHPNDMIQWEQFKHNNLKDFLILLKSISKSNYFHPSWCLCQRTVQKQMEQILFRIPVEATKGQLTERLVFFIMNYVNTNCLKAAAWTEEQLEEGQTAKSKPVHLFSNQPNKLRAVQQAHSVAWLITN